LLYTDKAFRLEERRKVKSAAYYERKKATRRALATAQKDAKIDKNVKNELAKYGY
jgi:large subunit ribosomal protein L13Ae